MKMAEAFAGLVDDFALVTQAHWSAWLRPRFDYEGWYGIRRPFRIVRIPGHGIGASPVIEGSSHLCARHERVEVSDNAYGRPPVMRTVDVL